MGVRLPAPCPVFLGPPEQLNERYDLCAIAITHRVGVCEIGDASVAIAVSAPHRQDALAACKDAIDTLASPISQTPTRCVIAMAQRS